MIIFGYLSAAVVLGALFLALQFNRLVHLRNFVKNSFSQIDVQMKRRFDLIPNLLESVKAAMAHERETLQAVVQARNQAYGVLEGLKGQVSAEGVHALGAAETQLQNALKQFSVVVESYPDLKANSTLQSLMEELTSTENKIGFARQNFNDYVMEFNTQCEVFPTNLVASSLGFKPWPFFQLDNLKARDPVPVSFSKSA
jgi:LemA protein